MTPVQMIAVIQAHCNGKTIQFKEIDRAAWCDCESPLFDFAHYDYRIAPPSVRRPHWPAICRLSNGAYVLSTCLYTGDEPAAIGFVRLATEYPPVMLP